MPVNKGAENPGYFVFRAISLIPIPLTNELQNKRVTQLRKRLV